MRNKSKIAVLALSVLVLVALSTAAVAKTNPDLELTADELLIDDSNAEVIAIGNVEFSRGNIKLKADKLTAQQELQMIEAEGNVVVNQLGRTLTAQHLQLNSQTEIGILTGSPQYKTEEMLIQGEKFRFDLQTGKLTVNDQVYLENKKEAITAEAEHLSYDRAKEEAILTGNVVAHKGERRMTAEKMTIDLETNKIKAEGRTTLIVPNANQKQGDQNAD
ncbi:LptA/OstA family protein [Halanaerobacter jeridensis]|uniref:Lipopolysaccharide export system protein LptA n=1 Tax=Halanaerobacter jeridensis TaxID=706427 RepID=A0A938XX85_9FIRM|nr:LptA/OstA family protein [Halanaerobacter jeridensis]MBM7556965.1 lipopolysaccharide export system protein LptA [Halanaerobacter jeridensis]